MPLRVEGSDDSEAVVPSEDQRQSAFGRLQGQVNPGDLDALFFSRSGIAAV